MSIFDRIRRAFGNPSGQGVESATTPRANPMIAGGRRPKPYPTGTYRRPYPPASAFSFDDDEERQAVYERILEWFPRYNLNIGASRARPVTVYRNVSNMDGMDLDLIMMIDRDTFRQMASVNPLYWYH